MNASDPRPRTQPYSNLERIVELVVAAHKAKASARTVVGASIAACRSATDSKSGNPTAGKKTSAAAAPSAAQIARTMRNAWNRSARRPASGAEISRIIVARDNVRPGVQGLRHATKAILARRVKPPQTRHRALKIIGRTCTDRQIGTLQCTTLLRAGVVPADRYGGSNFPATAARTKQLTYRLVDKLIHLSRPSFQSSASIPGPSFGP